MKLRSIALALSLLLLAGCSAGQSPSPSETPAPSETPPTVESPSPSYGVTPAPEGLTAEEELLYYLDIVLAGDDVDLMCWLSNGSGPTSVNLAPYKEQVRSLFAQLEWSYRGDKDPTTHEHTPADWGYYLQAGDNSVNMMGGTRDNSIDVAYIGLEGGKPLSYFAKGASDLAMAMVNLYPGPDIRFCLAEVPADSVSSDAELAKGYIAAFEKLYLESGDITDFELTSLGVKERNEGDDSPWHSFRMAFAVTPTDPTDPGWANHTPDSDGRHSYDFEMHMLLDEDNIWRCDWFQSPHLTQ